jgi:3-deoxy-D-manno-octulosonic-acid transferase
LLYFLYNLALTAGLIVTLPLLPMLFLPGSRFRAGLAQRLGFYSAEIIAIRETRLVWIHAAWWGSALDVRW